MSFRLKIVELQLTVFTLTDTGGGRYDMVKGYTEMRLLRWVIGIISLKERRQTDDCRFQIPKTS